MRGFLRRDALYQSLLTGPRTALHLKIAEEVERRNDNRLVEAAETLAHHYGQTNRFDKAFAYLALAGAKSLGLYSLEEAEKYLAAAIALLELNPECASDQQVAELLVDYTLLSNLSMRFSSATKIVERFKFRLDRLGANPSCVFITPLRLCPVLVRKASGSQSCAGRIVRGGPEARRC